MNYGLKKLQNDFACPSFLISLLTLTSHCQWLMQYTIAAKQMSPHSDWGVEKFVGEVKDVHLALT